MLKGTNVEVTPVITTTAYTSGDQLGDIQTLNGVNSDGGNMTVLGSLTLVDKAQQKIATDIFFFDDLPTVVSIDNGAANISDAEMIDKCIGHAVIAAGDYKDIGTANSVACIRDINLALKPIKNGVLYAVAVTRGTPTYAVGDLVFKYAFVFNW